MAVIQPFRAIRPAPESAARVAAVPYDVVNREEAAELARGNALSFLHVSRPEIDLPASVDPYSAQVYEKARSAFEDLKKKAPLVRDAEPSLYVYRLVMNGRSQTGIAGTFSVDEYDRGDIRKHEFTRAEKEDDRTRHVLALGAQTGPVFLAHRDEPSLSRATSEIMKGAPLYDFTADDGIQHTLWRVPDPQVIVEGFARVPRLYIADGHHRAASASRARAEKRKANPAHRGTEDYNFVLAVAFPASELRILPYHRVLKDLNGRSAEELLKELWNSFRVEENADPTPRRGEFSMYLKIQGGARWYGLKPTGSRKPHADPIENLDVTRLQDDVLGPLFGITDPRRDKRIDFVGGIRGTRELERLVNEGQAAVAFSMHPTGLEDLFAVSDTNAVMPPKSTWFEPKLRDGLVSHSLD